MLQNERKWIKKRFLRTLLRYKHRLIITITKCLGCWFSADVTASMLVDKNKSVSLRLKKTFLLILRKKNKQKNIFCNIVSRCVNQQPATYPLCHFPGSFWSVTFFEGVVPDNTFESVDEILWCDHLYETSLAELLHGTISLVCSSNF